jgi:hypothetical protein
VTLNKKQAAQYGKSRKPTVVEQMYTCFNGEFRANDAKLSPQKNKNPGKIKQNWTISGIRVPGPDFLGGLAEENPIIRH